MTDLLAYVRRNALPCAVLLLVLAVGLGGGYALAASKTKTITVCADKGTGILHLKTHGGRCKRGQTRVTWNQVGPQGPQGFHGSGGSARGARRERVGERYKRGALASGQGLSVQHVSAGTYQVTITAPVVCPRIQRTGGYRLGFKFPGRTKRSLSSRLVRQHGPQPAVHGVHGRGRERLVHADRSHLYGDGHLHVAGTWVEGRSASGVWRSQHRSQRVC